MARNFQVGVFTGRYERWGENVLPIFIGIREKFGHRYLSTEAGWNITQRLGTVTSRAQLNEVDRTLRRSLAQFEHQAYKEVP